MKRSIEKGNIYILITGIIALVLLAACGGQDEDESAGDDLVQSDVVINEISPKSGSGRPDWIELYNRGDTYINLKGWKIKDEKDRTPFVFKDEKLIEPDDFIVIEQDELESSGFVFGLGDSDEVRLYNEKDEIVDSISWKKGEIPEDKTIGRVPDGGDDTKVTVTPTPGIKNI